MAKDDLKNLPPEERIKRLKELEKERRKEIEDAQEEIKKSEEELTDRKRWEDKVPIPQVAKMDLKGATDDEKAILKSHRGLKEEVQEEEEPTRGKNESLEETIEKEKVQHTQAQMQYGMQSPGSPLDMGYVDRLSQAPVNALYSEIKSIEEKGYMTAEDQRKVEYVTSALEEKAKTYSFTKETAAKAGAIAEMGAKLQNQYKTAADHRTTYQS
jgi:hypothetical protein